MNTYQQFRLAYIEAQLMSAGWVHRNDLVKLGISKPAATKDLAFYRELNKAGVSYDPGPRCYRRTSQFKPCIDLWEISPILHAASMITWGHQKTVSDDGQ